jgi:methylglyoxal synthase
MEVVQRPHTPEQDAMIAQAMDLPLQGASPGAARELWINAIQNSIVRYPSSIQGMILITHELVEGRLDAVLHLTDWLDVAGKPDSMVLRREANVHNVHIASDITSASSAIRRWGALIRLGSPVFRPKEAAEQPLDGLSDQDRVLALIAHDGMKLDMCCFVVEHAREIFQQFDYVLATGTTGQWIRKFILAAGRTEAEASRVRLCRSGPYGGDVQIAAAVVKGICRKVIFLQDPFTSHAHETDIRLFEQAVLLFERAALKLDVELATNVESARMLISK